MATATKPTMKKPKKEKLPENRPAVGSGLSAFAQQKAIFGKK